MRFAAVSAKPEEYSPQNRLVEFVDPARYNKSLVAS